MPIKVRKKMYENNHTKHFNTGYYFFCKIFEFRNTFAIPRLSAQTSFMFAHFSSGI